MYDLSGSKSGDVVQNTINDWKHLVDSYQLNNPKTPNILTYKSKAVVAIWGVGFRNRDYTFENVIALIDFFKNDPVYGNCTVLLGVPTHWRELKNDANSDPKLHDVIKMADHVIDLGPEGGDGGGTILFEGTPEEMITIKNSHTAKFLALEMND